MEWGVGQCEEEKNTYFRTYITCKLLSRKRSGLLLRRTFQHFPPIIILQLHLIYVRPQHVQAHRGVLPGERQLVPAPAQRIQLQLHHLRLQHLPSQWQCESIYLLYYLVQHEVVMVVMELEVFQHHSTTYAMTFRQDVERYIQRFVLQSFNERQLVIESNSRFNQIDINNVLCHPDDCDSYTSYSEVHISKGIEHQSLLYQPQTGNFALLDIDVAPSDSQKQTRIDLVPPTTTRWICSQCTVRRSRRPSWTSSSDWWACRRHLACSPRDCLASSKFQKLRVDGAVSSFKEENRLRFLGYRIGINSK